MADDRQIIPVPLGTLDLQTPDIEAPDGMLRLLQNLVRRGNEKKPYYSPAEKQKLLYEREDTALALAGVRAIHIQVRQRAGSLTGGQADPGTALPAGWYEDGGTPWGPTDMPRVRQYGVSVLMDGLIYVLGGWDGAAMIDDVDVYDPVSNTWSVAAPLPAANGNGAAGVIGGKIYYAGGFDNSTVKAATYEYDPGADSWTELTSDAMPTARWLTGFGTSGGRLYVAGGFDGSDEVDVLEIFDPSEPAGSRWTTGTAMPAPRSKTAGAALSGKLYIFGGSNASDVAQSGVYVYDIGAGTWATGTAMPAVRQRHKAAAHAGALYVIGGTDNAGTKVATFYRLVPGGSWATLTPDPAGGRYAGAVGQENGPLYVFGGDELGGSITDASRAYLHTDGVAPGTGAIGLPSSLERIIAATDDKIYALDQARGYAPTELYTWPARYQAIKKVQFTQVGDVTFIAPSLGAGLGTPGPVLVLIDDEVIPFKLPPLPYVALTENGAAGKLEAGRYGVRFAWLLKDGTVAKASRPYTIVVADDAELQVAISAYREALPAYWSEIISGIQVAVSQMALTGEAIELMNTPYYQVAQISGTDVGKLAKWSDTNDNIPGYPLFEDDTLMNHGIHAGAVTSYNKRLVLGDVAYDFEQPDPLANAINPDDIGTSSNLAPVITGWYYDGDDFDDDLDDLGTGVIFGQVGDRSHIAIEIEDTDGELGRVAHEPSGDVEDQRIPVANIHWDGFVEDGSGGFWTPLIFGDDVDTTPGVSKKRFRIDWTPPPEVIGPGGVAHFRLTITGEDDDFGYSSKAFRFSVVQAGTF